MLIDFQGQVETARAIKEKRKKEEKEEAERDRLFNIKKYEDQLEQERRAKFLKDEKAKATTKANERLEREMLDHEAMEMARIRRDVEAKETQARNYAKIKASNYERAMQETFEMRSKQTNMKA